MHNFREVDSEDERNGAHLENELYFKGIERALPQHAPYPSGQEEDEGYYEDFGEVLSPQEYEDILFQRVLDKIRVARAIGNEDVQLTSEELDAYQTKLHGARSFTAHSLPRSELPESPLNDTASTTSVQAKHAHISSRSKKEKQRTSLFGSKSKREKDKDKSSQRKRMSTSSSIASHPPDITSPGFVIPDSDNQAAFAPFSAYPAKLAQTQTSPIITSRSTSGSHETSYSPQTTPPQDILGAFPGSEHFYRPANLKDQSQPPSQSLLRHQIPSLSVRQQAYARERELEAQGIVSAAQAQAARSIPFPVEMYQYQTFSTVSDSASPTSPQIPQIPQQYTRRVSSGQSEASYTSMPRRVPVPTPAVPVPLQHSVTASSGHSSPAVGPEYGLGIEVVGMEQGPGSGKGSGGGKDAGRKRKSGKGVKKKRKDVG